MDTSLLQNILYVVGGLSGLCMFIGFGINIFSSAENRKEWGMSLSLIAILPMLVAASWAGFNNFVAFQPEREAVLTKLSNCDSVQKRVNSYGYTDYVVTIDGKEYPVTVQIGLPENK